ncbi:SCO-spondin-like isoform X6 [Dreissena polymorpha]|uniref:SCO-spondin-like isoform X6 n=1 Tax=Dreissena polymorpha TaxID=45954 RepID=UPI0022645E59|nr:SCO-spondin-like isoform X6 [Dreissena polymorpha]
MNVFKVLVLIWSIYIFEQKVEALTCLKCDYVVQPRHCTTVISCPDDDSCFVEKQTNAFGETGYNLGCISKRSCRNAISSLSHCTQCCDMDLCNNAGCGKEGYPFQRAPVCYSCENPLPEGRCHSIDVCQEGEVCSLNGEDSFGSILYTSRCMPKDHCLSKPGSVLIGRRSHMTSTLTRSHGLHDCFNCCDADLCNTNCKTRDGQWGAWTTWSLCTSHCNQTRTRACDNSAPQHGGRDCTGHTTQTQGCYTDQCQIDGQWGSWTAWSLCTSHCNQTWTRACNNPTPQHGGIDCTGPTTQTQGCYTDQCQIDGQWGSWTEWSLCTSHCNQTRTRACDNPAPLHGGRDCHGLATQTQGCNTSSCEVKDCLELLSSGAALLSGVYTITTPLNHTKIQVYCDMVTDGGGGWTVFQRRFNGSVDFYRNFSEYENGFGQKDGEHWLGLKFIQEITSSGAYQLRVDFKRWGETKGYDVYENFSLQPGTNYTINIGSRLQSLGVFKHSLNGAPNNSAAGCAFSTYDHDVDKHPMNCAETYRGAWWYNACFDAINPNALYGGPETHEARYMMYGFSDADRLALAAITMMFKQA